MRKEYPISKPTLTAHIGDEGFVSDVNWAMPADNPYRGLVKVRACPPKHLVHPVLPVKHADRLVFPLRRKCMEGSVDHRPSFVRMKTEANGWKKEILNDPDPEKAKNEFIEAYRLKVIHLRKDKIKPNPGLKEYAKLGANNLWGRFGLRPNITKVVIVSKPSRLYEMPDGPSKSCHLAVDWSASPIATEKSSTLPTHSKTSLWRS